MDQNFGGVYRRSENHNRYDNSRGNKYISTVFQRTSAVCRFEFSGRPSLVFAVQLLNLGQVHRIDQDSYSDDVNTTW
jgi:hypothetical protein